MIKSEKLQMYLAQNANIPFQDIKSLSELELEDIEILEKLIDNYNMSKEQLGKILGGYYGYTYVDPVDSLTNINYMKKLGLDFITRYKVLPLYKLGKAVTVAMSEPDNPFLQAKIEDKLGELISVVFCFSFDIENYIMTNSLKNKL